MNTTKLNWLITDNNITVNYDGQTHIISRSDKLSVELIEALKARDFESIPLLVSKAKLIEVKSDGKFVVRNGRILVDGVMAPHALSNKILQFSEEGLPYEPLLKFAKNLQLNPSFRSLNQLFEFLEKNDHPITDTGCFIAYKKVQSNFLDVHSGTFDNSVGNVVEMPRNQVNEDPNVTCSEGLHVANFDYASNFYSGGLMLEVEVNPADVVAVPVDYNQAKMRVCKYKVLSVVDQEVSTPLRYTSDGSIDVNLDDEDDDEDSDEDESSELFDEESDSDESSEEDEDDEYPWKEELDSL
jgi:hypothetical protein